MNPRAAAVAVVILLGLASFASAQTGPVEVTGATRVEVDEASGLWHLTGSPVTVRRGRVVLRAPDIVYDTKRQVVEATGGVTYADPDAEFASAAATVWLAEERLVATGGVTGKILASGGETRLRADRVDASRSLRQMIATGSVTLVRGGITLTGDRIEYDDARQQAVATGRPAVSAEGSTLAADRIDAALAAEEVTAVGNVRMTKGDVEATAPRAVLQHREGLATLTGGVTVRQGRLTARAPTVVVNLKTNTITMTGGATLTLPASP